ncbi:hypothetical protein VaNZ11_016258 [Volvox africanus]|uniref:Uncharacterized protein n=1 Tax=Volvox africanus TaxID=51714 RepID=A0ABQ5SME1_9CHLO|nr:hypothetical protein VaNZ11_016258 [Volvox africanus]
MRAKVLVVPVYQKHWLYHVWLESTAEDAAAEHTTHWTNGKSLQEKASFLGKELSFKVKVAAAKQWRSIQAAEEGTFKNTLHRLAQWVLSREDPRETFLKSLPLRAHSLEIIHPCALNERLVQRRLRRMALAQEHYHNRRILGWALATLPQLPLVITPFPNVTLYFTAYKMVSHYQALQGCRMLRSAFQRYDQEQQEMRGGCCHNNAPERSRTFCSGGRGGGGDTGGLLGGLARLMPLRRRHAAVGCRGGCTATGKDQAGPCDCGGSSNHTDITSTSHVNHGAPLRSSSCFHSTSWSSSSSASLVPPLPEFRCSKALDKVVEPLERWRTPLSDIDAARIEQLFRPKPELKATTSTKWDSGSREAKIAGNGGEESEEDSLDSGVRKLSELVTCLRTQVLEGKMQERQRQRLH